MDLNELRLEIDKIDDQLIHLFVQRMNIAAQIAVYKKNHELPIWVPARESAKLQDVANKAGPELEEYTRKLYSSLFELSRAYQVEQIERNMHEEDVSV
jgi:chorismate mutase/prephenate dehydratase